jgi:2-dehydro-3-deoxygalactonokinase
MADSLISWAVALDGGTTNTRARLIDVAGGRIVATARRAVGVRDVVFSGGARPLDSAVREALDEVRRAAGGVRPDIIVAAGMLSAEVGLAEVPHAIAPAGLDELARGALVRRLPAIADRPIVFVPGVRTPAASGPDGWAGADVMRGEECETLGAWMHLPESRRAAMAFLWPGSHTKLVEVDPAGRVVRSQTTLAGELLQAMARHTLLAASLPEPLPDVPDPEALATGARLVGREGLGRAAFLVRVAALTGTLGPVERASFWIGAVVGEDVAHLARHPILQGPPPLPVWVGGRQPLRTLYATLLGRRHAAPVVALDDETAEKASAMGALAVARRRGTAQGSGLSGAPGTTG